jgi:hypothetical protein
MNPRRPAAALGLLPVVLCGLAAAVAFAFWAALPRAEKPHQAVPQPSSEGGYLGSGACAACHPSEHSSFSQTYHRTMTREAQELSFDGNASPQLPRVLELYGREFFLAKEGNVIRYRGPDLHLIGRTLSQIAQATDVSPAWRLEKSESTFRQAPEVSRELVLVTGSHHYLAFWIEGGNDQELRQLPFVYLLDEARFIPRKDAFLQPPDALPHVARWNSNCIQCHAVGGRPKQSEGVETTTGKFWEKYATTVAEEGISCEACHGPGKQHAEHYQSPWRRARARDQGEAKDIFLPDEHHGANASAACGQCHSYFLPKDATEWWDSGFANSFRPGESLDASRNVLRLQPRNEEEQEAERALGQDLSTIFWPDGSIMVGGREYNGLTTSACYLEGEGERKLSCAHCHSMHEGDPDKQLSKERIGDAMCTHCHSDVGADHTRHKPSSVGARCVNCHMPRTSYALLHGISSHHIASPSRQEPGPPNACALCHVDRDRAWIDRELSKFGAKGETGTLSASNLDSDPDSDDLPLAVTRALSGNAAERALFAYAFGTDEALHTAGRTISELVLPRLKSDPYAAIRLIAERSEKRVRSFTEPPNGATLRPSRLPTNADLDRLSSERDDTPIVISE